MRQKTTALQDFDPAHVRFGSSASDRHAPAARRMSASLQKRTNGRRFDLSASCQKRTNAVQQTSGMAFPVVSFVYLSVEGPSNKFYGINCRLKLGAKLLDRFFARPRQVSPPVNRLTHRFFDGSQHFLYCNFTVGSRHSAVASSFSR